MDNTLALQGSNPQINALGNFQQGQEAAAQTEANRFKMAAATMELIGSGAMYAMNGKIDGEVDPAKYAEVLDTFQQMGIDTSGFKDNPNFAKVAAHASITALQQIQMAQNEKEFDLAMDKFEQSVAQAAVPKPQSNVAKLTADFKAGLIDEPTYKAALEKATKASGTSFRYTSPDGSTVEFGDGAMPLGKTGQNQVDERALNASELGARLGNIATTFKPEYQTLGTRFANWFRSGKASLGAKLDPAEEQELSNFAKYRSGAIENLNAILKEMSGAAVTPQEYERIKSVMPNAGTGVWDGDDPVTFKAKLERAMTDTDKALARYQYYKANGIPGSLDAIPLTDVQKVQDEWFVVDRRNISKVTGKPTVWKVGAKPEEPE